ncbi:MAG: RagB/SusD family nutrient uptake outer membrane protein [Chitinophagaceae bacterium]|nr:RagB/SusD family nutrient uptake outer membrane protein [Chitinophagaceae bacterium]
MLRKTFITLSFGLVIVSLFSCKKWLDLQPQDGITGAEFWKTKEQVQGAVVGIYASLLGSPTNSRPLAEHLFLWGELRADMVSATTSTTNEEIDVINVNILPTNSIANWRTIYQTINYCNTVIDFAPGVLAQDATFTQAALNQYLSEAKALRGLMYFYLVRTFGEVPLKLQATSSDQQLIQIPKSNADTVLNQIEKDLNEAEANAVFTFGNQASDKGRITRYTINAIQADVYLWREKYNECVTACNKVINANKFGLIDGTSSGAWFNILYVNGNSNEGIFELQFDRQKINSFYTMLTTSRRRFQASPIVMDEIYTVDFIDPDKKDIRGDGASVRATDNTIWKYIGITSTTSRAQEESYAHWIIYRYADILLMKAEALNQLGSGQEALDLVYAVRNRARALDATDLNPPASDKSAVADFILQERAREFAFEGKRWFDLLRNARRNDYQQLDLLLSMVATTVPPDRQQSAITKFRDKNSHYLPVYFYEIQTDPALVQNPFYR